MNKANKTGFKAKRVRRSYCQTINAEPKKVFPLLCPVREAEWLEGWKYNLIYSKTGFAEEGCVFSTPHKGEENTIWIITKHDKDNHVVEFARFTPNSRTCVLIITVKPKQNNISDVYITYTYTSITDEGNQFIDDFTESEFLSAVKFWEKSMNYFLEKGEQLQKTKNE